MTAPDTRDVAAPALSTWDELRLLGEVLVRKAMLGHALPPLPAGARTLTVRYTYDPDLRMMGGVIVEHADA